MVHQVSPAVGLTYSYTENTCFRHPAGLASKKLVDSLKSKAPCVQGMVFPVGRGPKAGVKYQAHMVRADGRSFLFILSSGLDICVRFCPFRYGSVWTEISKRKLSLAGGDADAATLQCVY